MSNNNALECSVCCEKLNQTTRRLVACDFCPYVVCLSCTKIYILSTVHQPHCMSCRKEWSIEAMNKHFPKVFLREDLRKMREKILFEEEKTYLPPLQVEAERIMSIVRVEQDINAVQVRVRQNDANEDQLVRTQREIRRGLDQELTTLGRRLSELTYRRRTVTASVPVSRPCTIENCRGFLNDNYKCGLCHKQICKDCHHQIPPVEIGDVDMDTAHVCDPNEVATITELNKSTKPCPKCHARIFKTDGCDQMFCIQCHTAFSWRTGEIELGVIHNPHYFQALREGNIQDPRHRTHQGECGPIPSYQFIYSITRTLPVNEKQWFEIFYQHFTHHRQVTLTHMTRREDRDQERIKYLTGEYDEKTFKQKLYVHQQHMLRRREEHQMLDSYITIGEELFRMLTTSNYGEILQQLVTLKNVTEHAFRELDNKYTHAGSVRARDIFYTFVRLA